MSLSRSQRLTWTMSLASGGGGAPSAMRPACGRIRPSEPSRRWKEMGPSGAASVDQADRRQDPSTVVRIQLAVLGRERVDRRRDDDHPVPVHPLRHVLRSREHEGVGTFDVVPEERPCLVGLVVAGVATDVATPHDPHAGRPEPLHHAGRLRIVQQHDVAATDLGEEVGEVRGEDTFVRGVLGGTERAAVPRIPVQAVVQALRDGEELRLAVEHEPAVLDARSSPVREQGLEHLGDAATVGRRVHMPDRAIPEGRTCPRRGLEHVLRAVWRQDPREQLEGDRLDLDLFHPAILPHRDASSEHDPNDPCPPRRWAGEIAPNVTSPALLRAGPPGDRGRRSSPPGHPVRRSSVRSLSDGPLCR